MGVHTRPQRITRTLASIICMGDSTQLNFDSVRFDLSSFGIELSVPFNSSSLIGLGIGRDEGCVLVVMMVYLQCMVLPLGNTPLLYSYIWLIAVCDPEWPSRSCDFTSLKLHKTYKDPVTNSHVHNLSSFVVVLLVIILINFDALNCHIMS